MKKQTYSLAVVAGLVLMPALSQAQVVNETFENYADTAALSTSWNFPAGLSLATTGGNPGQAGAHDGSATAHTAIGTNVFSITPTDAQPLILTGDVWFSGLNNQRNTIGLRTGANPLFEMGFYNQAGANGLSVRLLNVAGGTGAWTELVSYTALGTEPLWIRLETTFTAKTATIKWDLGADSTIDGTQTWTGTVNVLPFSDLRFGGPSAQSSAGGGFMVDNIRLEVVPEPAAGALLGLGLTMLISFRRSRK